MTPSTEPADSSTSQATTPAMNGSEQALTPPSSVSATMARNIPVPTAANMLSSSTLGTGLSATPLTPSSDGVKFIRPKKLSHPRLAAKLYYQLRDIYITECKESFELVSCGPEAPDKTSFGDVDLLLGKVKLVEQSSSANQKLEETTTADSAPHAMLYEASKPTSAKELSQCEDLKAMGQPLKELLGAVYWLSEMVCCSCRSDSQMSGLPG